MKLGKMLKNVPGTDTEPPVLVIETEGVAEPSELDPEVAKAMKRAEKSAAKGEGATDYDPLPKDLPEEQKSLYARLGFFEDKNCYVCQTKDGLQTISNFVMQVLYMVRTRDQAIRVIKLRNSLHHEAIIQVSGEDFVGMARFKTLTESEGNFIFWGSDAQLTKIKRHLFRQEVPSREVDTLGWQPDGRFYAWANGIFAGSFVPIDEFGMVQCGKKHYYIPIYSRINADDDSTYETDKAFKYVKPEVSFKEWAALMYRAYGKNFTMALPYLCAAVYRDVVQGAHNAFPILNLYGLPGSGKGTFAASLLALFSVKPEQFMLSGVSTVKAFMRLFAQRRNGLVWLDEYTNSNSNIIEALKNIYDGSGYQRAQKSQDNRTSTTPIRSACLLSGQQMPTQSNALMTRVIMLTFTRERHDHEAFERLKELEHEGLTGLLHDILKPRSAVEHGYRTAFEKARDDLQVMVKAKGEEVMDRLLMNYSVLLAFYRLLDGVLPMPFSEQELVSFLFDSLIEHARNVADTNETAQFWQVFSYLHDQGELKEDIDYGFKDGLFLVKLQLVHSKYMVAYKRMYNDIALPMATLQNYLKSDPGFVANKVLRWGITMKPQSTWCFDYSKLGLSLNTDVPGKPPEEFAFGHDGHREDY